MIVLVTGANGMFGQDLCPILEDNGYDVVETDVENLDITDIEQCRNVLSEIAPDYVIHCAAYTNVDKAEDDIVTASRINITGTENLARVCSDLDIALVYISTDYVFDGEKSDPYSPSDKPNPINNYGLTKFKGEEAIKKYCKRYYIVRTSWLYGHHADNFVEKMISLINQPDLKVVDDQVGCPTWTIELANAIVNLIEKNDYGIYHVCGGGSTSWYNFAKEIFTQLGVSTNLRPCTTIDSGRKARRPKNSVMNNNNTCRDWKLALKDYINLRIDKED